MEEQKNQKKLTAKERIDYLARVASLKAEAKALSKILSEYEEDEETKAIAEDSISSSVVEAETEPAEEEAVEAEFEAAPAEEEAVEAEPEAAPAVEEIVEAEPEAAPAEENKKSFKDILLGLLVGGVIACVAGIIVLAIMLASRGATTPGGSDTNNNEQPPNGTVQEVFDMDAFVASTVNIANTLTTDEDIATNIDVFAEKIGADKLEKLVEKYGELPVQKAIAEFIAFVPEIKMNQYISINGLDYNPNATDNYYQMLEDADQAYTEATGKNPNGALMSLEGYDTYKSNREAMKALIAETGDIDLLTWYEAKTSGYDAMVQQNGDTETALDYKEEVKLELVNNVNGSVKLLELQLEQNVNGTNADTLKYTDVYAEFILNNYMYVLAN